MATSTGRYKSIKRADAPLAETGYLKAWVSLKTDITTLQTPVISGTPVIGEAFTIGTSHVWATGKDPIAVYVDPKSIEGMGESAGEIGSLRTIWKPKFFIKGDGPIVEEVVNNLLNEEVILFVQDQCTPAKFIQFGCDCLPCEFTKRSFTSGNLDGGKKGNELELKSYCKFFYNGTIVER